MRIDMLKALLCGHTPYQFFTFVFFKSVNEAALSLTNMKTCHAGCHLKCMYCITPLRIFSAMMLK